MTGADYAEWEPISVAGYAEAQVQAGHWTAEKAGELSLQGLRDLLPEGLATPNHHLWIASDAETGQRVGALWIAIRQAGGRTEAYVYDIFVDDDLQGGGYGRAIMEAASAAGKALGAEVMALNVFGYNDRAYNLYKSLGYEVANRHMRLSL